MKRNIFKDLHKWKTSINRLPLLLEGARQVGKTYILKEFGNNEFKVTHYFNFEEDRSLCNLFEKDLKIERILNELNYKVNMAINPDRDLIIFDEIQECPRALTCLKYFAENRPEQAICAAGSLLGVYLNQDSFPVGKVDFLKLHPFTFAEFLNGINEPKLYKFINEYDFDEISDTVHQLLWEKYLHYLIVGGLPQVICTYNKYIKEGTFVTFKETEHIQKNLIKGYLADIAKHSGKNNSLHIEKVWIKAASQLGEQQNGNASKFKFKDVINKSKTGYRELEGPISWLEKAGLVIRNSICNHAGLPFMSYTKDNLFKLFIFDIGMLRTMLNLESKTILDYSFGTYKGFYVENYVAEELLAEQQSSSIYSWSEGKAEIEFIIQKGDDIIPIEVKSGKNRRSKSLTEYNKKYSPARRVIISGANRNSENSIINLPLYLVSAIKKL